MGGRYFQGPGAGFGIGFGCGFGVGWGFGGGNLGFAGLGIGGGCGVGVGLGWGYGAAFGAQYIDVGNTDFQDAKVHKPNVIQAVQYEVRKLTLGAPKPSPNHH